MIATMEPRTHLIRNMPPVKLLPVQEEMLKSALPPKRPPTTATSIPASIFCTERLEAIALITSILLGAKKYEIVDYNIRETSGEWSVIIDDQYWKFRWRQPTIEGVRGIKGFAAFVKQYVTDSWILGYISMNHPKGVFRF